MLGHKTSPNKYRRIEIIQSIYLNYNVNTLGKKTEKLRIFTSAKKLNKTFINEKLKR